MVYGTGTLKTYAWTFTASVLTTLVGWKLIAMAYACPLTRLHGCSVHGSMLMVMFFAVGLSRFEVNRWYMLNISFRMPKHWKREVFNSQLVHNVRTTLLRRYFYAHTTGFNSKQGKLWMNLKCYKEWVIKNPDFSVTLTEITFLDGRMSRSKDIGIQIVI